MVQGERRSMLGSPSTFQAELVGTGKVAVGETVQKSKTSDAIKPGGNRWDPDCADILVESQGGKLNGKNIGWEGTDIGASERDRSIRVAVAEQAVVLIEDEFEQGSP